MITNSEIIDEIDEKFELENTKKVEAALFVAGRFLSLQEIVSLTNVNPIVLKKILGNLKDKYEKSGITIINKGNLWKMDVLPDYSWIVNKLATGSSEFSKAEQATLAVIAHKQPIKQSLIIKMRGNKAYDHIKKFEEMALITKKKSGHTFVISLSDNFFDYFQIGGSELKENSVEGNKNELD